MLLFDTCHDEKKCEHSPKERLNANLKQKSPNIRPISVALTQYQTTLSA